MAKKVSIYGILVALCIVLGWVENLISLSFIAPGIKVGLANSVCLLLVLKKDIKGAFLVNIARILLSSLLFSGPFSLLFSLSAGMVSLLVVALLSRTKSFGVIGFSIAGAVAHNITQTLVAFLIFGKAVLWYFPILLLSAAVSGGLVGFLCKIISKKIKLK